MSSVRKIGGEPVGEVEEQGLAAPGETGRAQGEADGAAPGEAGQAPFSEAGQAPFSEAGRAPFSEAGRVSSSEAERLLSRPALHARERQAPPAGVVRARVVGADAEGRPLVSFEQGPPYGIPAAAVWLRDTPDWSACSGLEVVIGFEHGEEARPIVLGLLEAPPDASRDVEPEAGRAAEPDAMQASAPAAKPKSLTIESSSELVFVCGQSKIILRADGSVTILGEKVVSRARTVNKIKGGSVQIN
jgi:hypothetical protein